MVAPRRPPALNPAPGRGGSGSVRIIGGRWRGSRLPVADCAGLRPSADRVRETLFNWLAPVLPAAQVLDLFAGTGALGFEAASRGAARSVLVERDPKLVASLRESAARLHAETVQVVQADALAWLRGGASIQFEVVFVDPPFAAGLWNPVLAALTPHLAAQAWIYVEAAVEIALQPPGAWHLHREGRTREVGYRLYRVHG